MQVFVVIVYWLCALAILQCFAGYPVWLALRARVAPRPVAKAEIAAPVTVIMAVHNGAAHLASKVDSLLGQDHPGELQLIVVLDGCSDTSSAILAARNDPRLCVIEHPRSGKAAALNAAVERANHDLLVMVDVRQRVAPDTLRLLLRSLADPVVGAVGGLLCLDDGDNGFAGSVDAYWRYETWIRSSESRSGSVVGVSGALYAIRRALYVPLPSDTILDDVLVPMQVVAQGSRVVLEPQARALDVASSDPRRERARKLRTLAGNYQLLVNQTWLLSPRRNPAWLRFICHKLLRLMAPWLLLGLVVAALVLAGQHWFYLLSVLGLAAALLLVIAGQIWPRCARWLPVRLLSAFLWMNLFAAQALWVFLRRRRLHLW